MEEKVKQTVVCYLAAKVVGNSAGIGFVVDCGVATFEFGNRFSLLPKGELLREGVENFVKVLDEFLKEDQQVEIYVSHEDYEAVREFLPERYRDCLETCNYNPAVQVAAEYAIGER